MFLNADDGCGSGCFRENGGAFGSRLMDAGDACDIGEFVSSP